ncbi:hypothetical protein DM860_003928 [Cuscuta australis]|uniref:F-box domain-containing protein n=1 Tax=Cuscuta australis TaxID=267555 RepID=A0A328CVP0_9ASTE|nr:hypothetical protein DM860_003928 [Cuscuta australis]
MGDHTRNEMAAMPFSLPEDLTIAILTKLPPKSLIRLTALNKTWFSFIRSPEFVSSYRSIAGTEQLLCRLSNDGSRFALIADRPDGDENLTVDLGSIINPDNRLPIRFLDNFHPSVHDDFEIIGSFNGLVCLCFSRWGTVNSLYDARPWTIFLWNPSIRRHLLLPPPRILPKMCGRLGFGGSEDGDHKVVRILWVDLNSAGEEVVREVRPFLRDSGGDHVVTVEIYSLNSGEWRILQFDLSPKRTFMTGQAFLQGRMHWISFKDNNPGRSTCVITSFSINEERFQDLPFPTSDVDFGQVWISVVGEKIGFLDVHFPYFCCVWVMQEYGNADSWAKLYNMEFEMYESRYLPLADAFKVWKDVEVFTPTNQGLENFKSQGSFTAAGKHKGDTLFFCNQAFGKSCFA